MNTAHSTLHHTNVNTVWLKAATLGSVWASLEIVVGSLLHNLRVPMAGMILAACGVALITASQMIWKDRGVVWRAGLICAIMKSISPSAVIFGPMVGIFSEALAMQLAIWILGNNRIALIVGGMLALLEPAIHRIVSILIEYGADAATLFAKLIEFAGKSLRVESLGPIDLILVYLALNMSVGLVAALIGLSIARRVDSIELASGLDKSELPALGFAAPRGDQVYRAFLIPVHFAVMILSFLLMKKLEVWQTALIVAFYCALCAWNYPGVRRSFRKPKLWIELLIVGVLASLLLGNITSSETGWTWSGMVAGLRMMLRAVLVITAFSAIGMELRNPRIVDWFVKRRMGTLSAATNVAFEALPTLMAELSEQKKILSRPIQSFATVLARGIHWFDTYQQARSESSRVLIVTGESGSGKTTKLGELAVDFREKGLRVGGVLQPAVWEGGCRVGYDVMSISSGERRVLCRETGIESELRAGRFFFDPRAFEFGLDAIGKDIAANCDVMILDEIGPLELSGQGWSQALDAIMNSRSSMIVLSVRPSFVEDVKRRWAGECAVVMGVGNMKLEM